MGVLVFVDEDYFRIVPHLQVLAGLSWGTCLSCNKYYFSVRASYEVNSFWNIPQAIYPDLATTTTITPTYGFTNRENRSHTLLLSGVTADLRFDF